MLGRTSLMEVVRVGENSPIGSGKFRPREYTSAMRCIWLSLLLTVACHGAGIDARVKHGYADSSGVKIHYASLGTGPLIVMIHGFPDFWYTWREQMEAL